MRKTQNFKLQEKLTTSEKAIKLAAKQLQNHQDIINMQNDVIEAKANLIDTLMNGLKSVHHYLNKENLINPELTQVLDSIIIKTRTDTACVLSAAEGISLIEAFKLLKEKYDVL